MPNGTSPGQLTAMPSAMVGVACTASGRPAASEPGYGATASACTPTTCIAGSMPLTATVTPATRPPPPVGTTTVRTGGHCSAISMPSVPCPATMSGWSYGWMNTAPVRSAKAMASATASSTQLPCSMTSAP